MIIVMQPRYQRSAHRSAKQLRIAVAFVSPPRSGGRGVAHGVSHGETVPLHDTKPRQGRHLRGRSLNEPVMNESFVSPLPGLGLMRSAGFSRLTPRATIFRPSRGCHTPVRAQTQHVRQARV